MRFSKIVHPEIILDRRGPELDRKYYREVLKQIKYSKEGFSAPNNLVNFTNVTTYRAVLLMKRWQLDNGKIYHISRDFLLALSGIERGVCLDYLPDRFVGYISFPDSTIYDDDNEEIEGVYVYVGPSEFTALKDQNIKKVLWAAYICKEKGKEHQSVGSICIELIHGEMIENTIKRIDDDNKKFKDPFTIPIHDLHKKAFVHNTIINVVMYLHSQEPKVQRMPSGLELSNKKAKELAVKVGGLRNECTLPVFFINWNYAKQRIYTVDKTWVETFLRWQPCGPGYSQVKLIWVQEHERHYKKD